AAQRAAPAASAVHAPQARGRAAVAAALAQRQVRSQPAAPGAGGLMSATNAIARPASCMTVGGIALDRLTERVGSTPFFAYDRARLTERIELVRAPLPAEIDLSYAVKPTPMPAVSQPLSGLVAPLAAAPAREMRPALDTPMPAERVSF